MELARPKAHVSAWHSVASYTDGRETVRVQVGLSADDRWYVRTHIEGGVVLQDDICDDHAYRSRDGAERAAVDLARERNRRKRRA